MRRVNQQKIAIVLSVVGIILLTIGLSIFVLLWWEQQNIEKTSLLTRKDEISSISNSVGQEILLEGKLSVTNQTHAIQSKSLGSFVISKIERSDRPFWNPFEQVTPRLLLDVPHEQIRVVNDDYIYKYLATRTVDHSDIFFAGLRPGEQVVVIGTVVQDTDGVGIQADYIGSGPRNVYIENLNLELLFLGLIFYPVAWLCLGVSLLFTILAVAYHPRDRGI